MLQLTRTDAGLTREDTWPGQPVTAHWGITDPAVIGDGDEARHTAFSDEQRLLRNRIRLFTCLPLAKLDRLSLEDRLYEIGKS